jgi:transposase
MRSMRRAGRGRQGRPDPERGVVVGVDLAKDSFEYGCFGRELPVRTRRGRQGEAGFQQLEAELVRLREQGREVWVAYEPTGPYGHCLVEWLEERQWRVVGVSPFHVFRSKEVRDNSPAKSDQKDPEVIADLVWQGCYFQPRRVAGAYAELRVLSREWESLRGERTRLRNEFQSELMVWFPELRRLFQDALAKSIRAVVRGYRSVEEIGAGGGARLEAVLRAGTRGQGGRRAEAILAAATHSVALARGGEARRQRLLRLLARLEALEAQQGQVQAEMEHWLEATEETPWLLSVPGLATITVAGILGECGPWRDFPAAPALEKFLGLNLCPASSGQWRGQPRISKRGGALGRYLLCQAALRLAGRPGPYQAQAKAFKARGKTSGQIRVALARKLLRMLFALVREQRAYRKETVLGEEAEGGPVIPRGKPQQLAA